MKVEPNDNVRAAIIAFAASILPVLQLIGLFSLTGDEMAIVMLAISNGVTLGALVLKQGQSVPASGLSEP